MTEKDWIINIECMAESICRELGSSTVVLSVFKNYGADCVEGLIPSCYPDVFSDLQQIESDLN